MDLIVREDIQQRLSDSLETVLSLGGSLAIVDVIGGEEFLLSQNYACPDCNISIEEMDPRMFSFNTPYGACEVCNGLGSPNGDRPFPYTANWDFSLNQGALSAPGWNMSMETA